MPAGVLFFEHLILFRIFRVGFENNPRERSQKLECTFFLDFSAKIAQKGRFMQFLGLF
jgi:hypothetical protein